MLKVLFLAVILYLAILLYMRYRKGSKPLRKSEQELSDLKLKKEVLNMQEKINKLKNSLLAQKERVDKNKPEDDSKLNNL